jgi:biofilm PGA synthesis N-glycosyltransferase PgaC
MLSLKEMTRAAIGVMVHNEAGNLPRLLARLRSEEVPGTRLDPIIVVSSGSTDDSDVLAAHVAAQDHRVQLIREPERTGKARAINRFLTGLPADVDRCVLISGDVLPETGAIGHLFHALGEEDVGMTGAQVIPVNPRHGLASRVVHTLWAMHHVVATRQPKLGEMVAFETNLGPIDPSTPVDEATIEAQCVAHGKRLAYVPDARVYNRGPSTLGELIAQRQRIWQGHRWLAQNTGYAVATYHLSSLIKPTLRHLMSRPRDAPFVILAAGIELWSRLRGSLSDQPLPTVWPRLPSTKAPIHHG